MTVKNIVTSLLNLTGQTQSSLANSMGLASPANIAVALSRSDGMGMRVETLIKWFNSLGYQIVIRPIDQPTSKDEFVLDGKVQEGIVPSSKAGRPPKNSAKNKKAAEEPQPSKILLEIPQPEKLAAPPVIERLPDGNWLIHLPTITEDTSNRAPVKTVNDISSRY